MAWIDDGDGGWQEIPPYGSEPRPNGNPPSAVRARDAANGVVAGPSRADTYTATDPAGSVQRNAFVRDMTADIDARRGAVQGQSSALAGALDTSGQFGAPALPGPAERLQRAAGGRGEAFGAAPVPAGARPGVTAAPAASPFGGFDLAGAPGPSKVETAATQAGAAVGPAPQIDMGLADRQLGAFEESLAMSREVLDRLLNAPSVARAIGDQALSSQLAIQRSARGGPGAVAAAADQAAQAAPGVTQAAAVQASSEDLARTTAAGNVASNFAQAALGARGQDVGIAAANQAAAVNVMQQVTQLTGVQLQLDQQSQELIGQMARDFAQLDYNWAALSFDQQQREFDRWVTVYGIDKNFAAQIKAISASKKIGPMDVFNGIVGVLGGGASVAVQALKK